MKYSGKTDIGLKRKSNQDSFTVISKEHFFSAVVCDGMGGAKGGNIASNLAVKAYTQVIKSEMSHIDYEKMSCEQIKDILIKAVSNANKIVFETANYDTELEGMGTTLVSVLICNGNTVACNVGDSRLYTYRDKKIKQITHDHSFVQYLLDKGSITREEATSHPNKNIILRALGVNESVEPEIFCLKDEDYELLLLCSDGLTTHLSDEEIQTVISENNTKSGSLKKKAEALIAKTNEKGGIDNITAVLIGKN
ncbi:MAG: Stp1/IreP family PP2C-type Ser/Thr phosphatase [Eubacteriales bacterium]|mgnify:CR=1 FL=1|nr:Stp1/IreP family PP2C-type Ser/Thr phosphatase [Eubacteriales bacterium]MDD4421603.1 Stp1/IreP family PP2C-type Ser/Thr phosphatase [Eubacteriales bacterium]